MSPMIPISPISPITTWWKFIFDAKSPTWTSYGRVIFVQADTEEVAKAAALLIAQDDFPQSAILPIAIGQSTPEAAELFADKKRRFAAWQENNRRSVPNDRSIL